MIITSSDDRKSVDCGTDSVFSTITLRLALSVFIYLVALDEVGVRFEIMTTRYERTARSVSAWDKRGWIEVGVVRSIIGVLTLYRKNVLPTAIAYVVTITKSITI